MTLPSVEEIAYVMRSADNQCESLLQRASLSWTDLTYIAAAVLKFLKEEASQPFSKGYTHRHGEPVSDACGEGRHSECTQDLTKCHCTFRGGHTVLHAYMNPEVRAAHRPDTREEK